jgi:energy-coupling factor transporter ATP-binding protein EcfA2
MNESTLNSAQQTQMVFSSGEESPASTGVTYSSTPCSDDMTSNHDVCPAQSERSRSSNRSQSLCSPIAQTQAFDDDKPFNPKSCNTAKYNKNKGSKVKQNVKECTRSNAEYDAIIVQIREARRLHKPVQPLLDRLAQLKKAKKKKWVKNASFQSSAPSSYGCALLDGLHAVIQHVETIRETVGEGTLSLLLDLFTTLYNVYKNPTWDSALVNATSFFMRNFAEDYAAYALQAFQAAFEIAMSLGPNDQNKTARQFILNLFSNSSELLNDAIWTNISKFFVKIAAIYGAVKDGFAMETIDMTTLLTQFSLFRKTLPDVRDIFEMAFDAYEFVLGSWEHVCSGDWSKILLGKDETQIFEIEVRVLEQAYPLVINNQEVELLTLYKMTPQKYEARLTAAIKFATSLVIRCTNVQQRMAVSTFVRTLTEKQAALYARIAEAPVREQPYSIKLSGPSGCGKSTLVNMLSKTILFAYGCDPTDRGSVVFTNIDENFESTIHPSHKGIVADDVCNNLNKKPNYDRLLNYNNTVPRPLEKADVKEKGVLYPGNNFLMTTTNDITLRATECSVCPESILRRFDLDVVVAVRSEFRNEFGGLIKMNQPRYDVYEFILKRFKSISIEGDIEWDIVPRSEWNSDGLINCDLAALTKFLATDVATHRVRVAAQAKAQKEFDEGGFCTECGSPDVLCYCGSKKPIAGMQLGTYWSTVSTADLWDFRAAMGGTQSSIVDLMRKGLFYKKVWRDRQTISKHVFMLFGAMILGSLLSPKLAQPVFFIGCGRLVWKYQQLLKEVETEIARRSDRLSSLCLTTQDHLRSNMTKYFVAGTAILMLYKSYQIIRPFMNSQDKSTYFEEMNETFKTLIDSPPEGKFNYEFQDARDYKEGYSRLTPKETKLSKTTTSSDLQLSLAKALRVVIVKSRGKTFGSVNGIMVASNVIMVPAHIIPYTFPFDIETTTTPGVPSASTKDQKLTENYCHIDRERDVAFIHLATSPASSDFSQFFPEEEPTFYGRSTVMLWKSSENEVKISKQVARQLAEDLPYAGMLEHPGRFYGESKKFTVLTLKKGLGLRVDLEFPGFGGLCGAMYVDASSGIIYGFHVAGYSGSCAGFLTCVTQPMIKKAMASLKITSPTLQVHSCGTVKVDTYGMPYTLVDKPPLYLRSDGTKEATTVTYMGAVLKDGMPMENRARTPYVPTPFVGVVEAFGESRHRPPTKPNDVAKGMKTLNKLTTPVQHYEGGLLERAVNDYKDHTLSAIRKNREVATEMLRVYTQEEAMDGIGEFGLGGLPNSTSAGFPISKSKKHCLVRDPMDEGQVQVPRAFNDNYPIQEEIDRTEQSWANGLRSESIYKASSKVNELLPNDKAREKVRKFYGSGFANFVASRKVLAGVPRFMREFWKDSECLVGIDATSREWSEFHDYLSEYGTDKMIAGDFSGFDTRMAAQITGAAAKIIVSWYEEVGCTPEEIQLITGALSDIIHPNILFDGDLYRFANGNPSGNMITVQLNSICNSLMMRYVYYAMMPKIREPFAMNVRLGTYGDDNAMSVKKHCKWYTHTTCQEEFAKLDIGYTMAEKSAQSVHYISMADISFLKRKFVYHETLKKIVAPIENDSILKKFHYIKKPNESPLSPEEQFGAYTDTSLREAYLHGEKYYNDFLRQIGTIVNANPLLSHSTAFIPYEEMTLTLKPAYEADYVNDNSKLFMESCGLDIDDDREILE